jgi:pimeloyl-ACP methyl ester carboxylesterase
MLTPRTAILKLLRLVAVAFGMAAACAGCTIPNLAAMAVDAPNRGRRLNPAQDLDREELQRMGVDGQCRVEVGPPAASIVLWIIEPKDVSEPAGTILVLHGYADGSFWMLGKAKDLAQAGYRTVLVSRRGHGRSTGDYRTFGAVEKRDLVQITDHLETNGMLDGALGVWGMSYGASVAIQYAAVDPRVRAVVAVSGFSSMREIVPDYSSAVFFVDGWFRSDEEYQAIVDAAGARGGFDPDDTDAAAAMRQTDAPVLILHGTSDALVPYEHAERLFANAGPNCRLVPLEGAGHVGSWMDLDHTVATESRAWFDRWLDAPLPPTGS